jgi:phage tail-like protein
MPVEPLSEPTPKSQYFLYEMIDKTSKKLLAEFDMLTGGEQTISTVSYEVIDEYGNVTTRFMPGQTTFSPVSLLRAIDAGAIDVYAKFTDAIAGKLKDLRRNYSISMNDSKGDPLVWWHLYNAIPIKVSGFDFNMRTESVYTDFTVDIQAEYIEIEFP